MATFDELRWKKFPIGSDGFVCLVDAMGNDAAVVQAARVSYGQDSREDEDDNTRGDRQLIRYLMRHHHGTPFEMAEVKLLVRVPMDTWRQWIRHRTANVNEYSTRYTTAIDSMATTKPEEWRLQAGSNKQGSDGLLWSGEATREGEDRRLQANSATNVEEWFHGEARRIYKERLAAGIAREQARKDLPLSTYTEAYWKCDLRNILHFLGLRMDSHAQQEIREYATVIGEQIIKPLFPVVWEAFEDYQLGAMSLSRLDILMIQSINELKGNIVGTSILREAFDVACHKTEFMQNGWNKDKCRERDECKAKLERMGLL
jgi:thymidylate synthase (FAD)